MCVACYIYNFTIFFNFYQMVGNVKTAKYRHIDVKESCVKRIILVLGE